MAERLPLQRVMTGLDDRSGFECYGKGGLWYRDNMEGVSRHLGCNAGIACIWGHWKCEPCLDDNTLAGLVHLGNVDQVTCDRLVACKNR